jgi:membrane protein
MNPEMPAPKGHLRKKGIKKIVFLFKETFIGFVNDNVLKLSAALSYFTIFSLPALLIIVTSLCGLYFGTAAIQGELYGQIKDLVGEQEASQIQEMVKNVHLSAHTTFATVVGVTVLVIGASGIFSEIQDSINYIWGIKTKPKRGLVRLIMNRLMSFSLIASVGFLLLVGLIISSLMEVLNRKLMARFSYESIYLYYGLNLMSLFILITILFLIIFKVLPDGKVSFRDCLLGAIFTAILFMAGKFAIGAYLSTSSVASIYGSAGSVVIILAWVYYSAVILYFGAEFTKVYSKIYGDKIIPNKYTVLITKPQGNL